VRHAWHPRATEERFQQLVAFYRVQLQEVPREDLEQDLPERFLEDTVGVQAEQSPAPVGCPATDAREERWRRLANLITEQHGEEIPLGL